MGVAIKKKVNLWFTVFLFVVLAIAFGLTFGLNPIARQIPRLIAGLGMVLAIIEIVVQVRTYRNISVKDAGEREDKGVSWYFGLLFAAAYICLMFTVGFAITTPLFLFIIPMVLGYRKIKVVVPFSIITTAVLYYSFTYIFLLDLPDGMIGNLLGR